MYTSMSAELIPRGNYTIHHWPVTSYTLLKGRALSSCDATQWSYLLNRCPWKPSFLNVLHYGDNTNIWNATQVRLVTKKNSQIEVRKWYVRQLFKLPIFSEVPNNRPHAGCSEGTFPAKTAISFQLGIVGKKLELAEAEKKPHFLAQREE